MNNGNLTPEQLIQMAKLLSSKGESEEKQAETLKNFAFNNMSKEQAQTFNNVINDRQAMEKLLSSEQAQTILKKIGKK